MHDSWRGTETATVADSDKDPPSTGSTVVDGSRVGMIPGYAAFIGAEAPHSGSVVQVGSASQRKGGCVVEKAQGQDDDDGLDTKHPPPQPPSSQPSSSSPAAEDPRDCVDSIGDALENSCLGSFSRKDDLEDGSLLVVAKDRCFSLRTEEEVDDKERERELERTEGSKYMNLRNKTKRKPSSHQERLRPKRQAARDMCRPLKQWLYGHREVPYPTKAEKQELAHLSHMTLTQVSNWFANARRRLKNTVSGGPNISWAKRIKLYNSFVVGNQELLSISSDDTMWDEDDDEEDEEKEENVSLGMEFSENSGNHPLIIRADALITKDHTPQEEEDEEEDQDQDLVTAYDVNTSTPAKFKKGILQRYLNDAYQRVFQVNNRRKETDDDYNELAANMMIPGAAGAKAARRQHRHRNTSGSLSSHDYEEISLSPQSNPTTEHQPSSLDDSEDMSMEETRGRLSLNGDVEDLHWKEISAALALTNLAMRSRIESSSSMAASGV